MPASFNGEGAHTNVNAKSVLARPAAHLAADTRIQQALDFSKDALADFWGQAELAHQGLRSGVGCYIFAVRAGKGITPWYVGQSKGAFEKECFAYQKQAIYREVMDDIAKGTPILFLIVRMTPKGRLSKREAGEVRP